MTVREKAYKFRLCPNKEQRILINKSVGCARYIYNHFLAKAKENEYQTYTKYSKQLTQLKKELKWLKEPDKFSLQNALKDLDRAFKNFFKGKYGFPKFKSKKNPKNSYRTNKFTRKSGTTNIEIKDNKIKLPKLGWIKFRKSKEVKGEIINVTVTRTNTDKYFISIAVKEEIEESEPELTSNQIITSLFKQLSSEQQEGVKLTQKSVKDMNDEEKKEMIDYLNQVIAGE